MKTLKRSLIIHDLKHETRSEDSFKPELINSSSGVDEIVFCQKRLSVHEAACYTGMSVDTIRTLCQQGQIPFYRSGQAGSKNGKILFRIETLDRWMEQQERANCPGWE